ncbi:MAG: DUF718 domain-containing protein [Gammaproteobacteria bacterium]|nr:DUF718 domain-containing protein [Gammaproteobacteria bacterium]
MTAFNIVRFQVKDGMDEQFLKTQQDFTLNSPGFQEGHLIKSGDHRYCFIGMWDSAKDSLNAENDMVSLLDQFRDTLEDQGTNKGVTDFDVGDALIDYYRSK